MRRVHYAALVKQDYKEGPYGVSFPDFPGCVALNDTLALALLDAEEALAIHVEGMLEDEESVPSPTEPENIDRGTNILALVPVNLPGKVVRKSITIDEDLWKEIAKRVGNVSAFLANAAREKLRNIT